MIDDRPRIFSFDDPRDVFLDKLAQAECEAVAIDAPPPSPASDRLRDPLVGAGDEGDEEVGRLSRFAARWGL